MEDDEGGGRVERGGERADDGCGIRGGVKGGR